MTKLSDEDMRALVGENLRRIRRQAVPRVTQQQLADKAALHRTEVGLIERGRRMPDAETMFKLTASLGVSPLALLEGVEWNPAKRQFESAPRLASDLPRKRR